jgi:hypothetical protein
MSNWLKKEHLSRESLWLLWYGGADLVAFLVLALVALAFDAVIVALVALGGALASVILIVWSARRIAQVPREETQTGSAARVPGRAQARLSLRSLLLTFSGVTVAFAVFGYAVGGPAFATIMGTVAGAPALLGLLDLRRSNKRRKAR